ncbi:MAG: hypothetical protein OM95_10385 [Bdellovibrio sp. ArHS]|uniref:substrate-binding periplasmic protein n=1 Tax=Bdellovibrio sp. ArHS TaxID=1569284 RepID=UPI000582D768|nr:transporter substrate-binding domain-containing protein [Bdellovibrio sp. ArHS]KHD88168.1 MAG: hypothetical protein OM95_10385 [Bdellovibrio sp. ArHS]
MVKLFFLSLLISTSAWARETWLVATLDWPPYTCSKCHRNGIAAEALRSALAKEGIVVEFIFYPWVQAQKNGSKQKFVGYFPAWKEEVLPGFTASEILFSSPVIFVQRKDRPLVWNQLKDLKGKTFAITRGYGNTEEFNALVKKGDFKTLTVLSEESTLTKLVEGAVDGVLMDLRVAEYYLQNQFAPYTDKIAINPKVIEYKNLYFAFNQFNKEKKKKIDGLTLEMPPLSVESARSK